LPSVDSGPKILDDMAYEFRAVSCKEDVAIYSSIDYKLSNKQEYYNPCK